MPSSTDRSDADVIVVGAGPAGSATAYHLAQAGLDVLLLEKTEFPREKVCGDGLTPRAVKQLVAMGIDTSHEAGWLQNKGLRIIGGGQRFELPWPELAELPRRTAWSVRVRTSTRCWPASAQKAGASLRERTAVTGPDPRRAHRAHRGVTRARRRRRTPGRRRRDYRAPLVVAADGNSSRLSLAHGPAQARRPPDGRRRAHLLPQPAPRRRLAGVLAGALGRRRAGPAGCCPATAGSSAWATAPSTSDSASSTPARPSRTSTTRTCSSRWLDQTPEEWGFRDENMTRPVAARPCRWASTASRTTPADCCSSATPAGMVNPFNGEGIAYAMESGALAAEVIAQALAPAAGRGARAGARGVPARADGRLGRLLHAGPALREGRSAHPQVMRLATQHGLHHTTLMRFILKLLANLTDPRDGDVMDRIVNGLSRLAPSACRCPRPAARPHACALGLRRQPPSRPRTRGRRSGPSSEGDGHERRRPAHLPGGPVVRLRGRSRSSPAGCPAPGATTAPSSTPTSAASSRPRRPVGGGRFAGEVLPHRDALHRLRHRDRLPLPLGRDLRRAGLVRAGRRWCSSSSRCSSPMPTSGDAEASSGTDVQAERDMGIEEKLPSGFLLTTVEQFAGYARKASCGRPPSAWPAAPSR